MESRREERLLMCLKDNYKMMLCRKYAEFEKTHVPTEWIYQLKYDGCRLAIHLDPEEMSTTFITRGGKKFALPVIGKEIYRVIDPCSYTIIDVEMIRGEGKREDRSRTTGLLNSILSDPAGKEKSLVLDSDVRFVGFDKLTIDLIDANYILRYRDLWWPVISRWLTVPKSYLIKHTRDIISQLEHLESQGYEGLVAKKKTGLYKFGRSKDCLKIKNINRVEVKCIEVKEGEGKYTGQVGALVCEDSTGRLVTVGSGLTDESRRKPFKFFPGKCFMMKYESMSRDNHYIQPTLIDND